MKVIALTLATLCLVVAQALAIRDFELRCSRQEIGIRWPSYYSNSDYYICEREGGRQMKHSCPDGLLFTFALQSCMTPSKFIPPPPMNVLPTASPLEENAPDNSFTQEWLPKPIYTNPPTGTKYPSIDGNVVHPPSIGGSLPRPPINVDEPLYPGQQTEDKPLAPPTLTKPQLPELSEQPEIPDEVPQPPTPAPTTPVVQPPKKKTPPAPPSASQKQTGGKKQPPKPVSKKDQAEKQVKKTPPKPVSKAQKAKVQPPKPVSKTQQ